MRERESVIKLRVDGVIDVRRLMLMTDWRVCVTHEVVNVPTDPAIVRADRYGDNELPEIGNVHPT